MTSKSQETTQNLEHGDFAKDGGGTGNHTYSHDEFCLSMDQLNQEFHISLDLKSFVTSLSPIELNDGPSLSMKEPEVPYKKETKRRYAVAAGTTRNENDSYLDLKLSPPGVSLIGKSSYESKSSSPRSQDSCISVEVDSNDKSVNNPPAEGSSLILMGCTLCLLYVMVPDADPKCPRCNSSRLLDVFCGNRAKRSRRN